MRKMIAAGLAALTFGGAIATAALPATAEAHEWRGGYGGWEHHHNNTGAVVAAGIAGLAIGAALSNSHPHYYQRSYYYGPTYYDDDDDYGPPAVCVSRHWVWDPYIGRHVLVTRHYPC